jgi:phasin family protein
MNPNANIFDPKNNPFLNTDFSKFFTENKAFALDTGKLLESQSKTVQALSEANREFVECLRKVAAKQGALIAEISQKSVELTQGYPYGKSPQDQVDYQVTLVNAFQKQVLQVIEETQGLLEEGGKKVTTIISDRTKDLMSEASEGGSFKKDKSEKSEKKPS